MQIISNHLLGFTLQKKLFYVYRSSFFSKICSTIEDFYIFAPRKKGPVAQLDRATAF